MAHYSLEVIEKYRSALIKNPKSQVFAPLADAYREMNQLLLAEKTCKEGLKNHPQLASGWVVLGKIQKDQKKLDDAVLSLNKALTFSSDNILAHQLLGEIYLERREADLAIKAYKMVLFFNPYHSKVKKILEKIESLSAKGYSEDMFQFKKLDLKEDNFLKSSEDLTIHGVEKSSLEKNNLLEPSNSGNPDKKEISINTRSLLRILSLLDAFIARNELAKAHELVTGALNDFPGERELLQRSKILRSRQQIPFISTSLLNKPSTPVNEEKMRERSLLVRQKKLEVLNSLLLKIESLRN